MAEAGVLPDLKPVRSRPAQHRHPAGLSTRHQRAADTKPANQTNEDRSLGTELFDSIIELMSATRRAGHAARSGGDPRPGIQERRLVVRRAAPVIRAGHGRAAAPYKYDGAPIVGLFEPGIADSERASRMQAVPEIRDEISLRVQRMGNYSRTAVDALLALLDDPQSWHPDDSKAIDVTRASSTDGHAESADVTERHNTDGGEGAGPSGCPTEAETTMIERLNKMRPGTWFEITPNEGGQAQRIKLSWISPLTSCCMFVDKSGIQAETRTLRALARDVLSGHAKVVPRPRSPFIDRALVSIRKILQRDKGEPETPQPTP